MNGFILAAVTFAIARLGITVGCFWFAYGNYQVDPVAAGVAVIIGAIALFTWG